MIAESGDSTESIPHPLARQSASAASAFSGLTADGPGGSGAGAAGAFSGLTANAEGNQIAAAAQPYLVYLSELADRLGVIDPVEAYFRPLLGRWSDLGAEADRLRQAAATAAAVSAHLDDQLGRLDAGWEGRDADSFVAYIREIGAAGHDLQEALDVLATALDDMVTAVRHVVVDLVEVLVDAADLTSETMLLPSGGTRRARAQLQETQESVKALYETARDVMEAFNRLCDGVDDPDAASQSIEIRHRYPQERFKLHDAALNDGGAPGPAPSSAEAVTTPSSADAVTTPSSAGDPAERRHTGAGIPENAQPADAPPQPAPAPESPANHGMSGVPMMPMMGFGTFGGGGQGRRPSKTRPVVKSSELLGEPGLVAPPVIGEDENTPPQQKKPPAPPDK